MMLFKMQRVRIDCKIVKSVCYRLTAPEATVRAVYALKDQRAISGKYRGPRGYQGIVYALKDQRAIIGKYCGS